MPQPVDDPDPVQQTDAVDSTVAVDDTDAVNGTDPSPVIETLGDPAAGPTLAVLGGVHGDEPEGVLAAGALLAHLRTRQDELAGAVRIVRIANPAAFAQRARIAAGDDNLARVFPGDAAGSPAQRIADRLAREVITAADLLVDLHSAGFHYEMPVFVGYDTTGPAGAAAAAEAFGAPVLWRHPSIGPGRTLSAATALGVPSIYVEGSGGGGVRGADLDVYRDGLLRVVAHLGILPDGPAPAPPPRVISRGDGNIDSSVAAGVAGWCVTRVVVGQTVEPDQTIAEIRGADGLVREVIVARTPGVIMMLRRTAAVAPGDGIAMIAELAEP